MRAHLKQQQHHHHSIKSAQFESLSYFFFFIIIFLIFRESLILPETYFYIIYDERKCDKSRMERVTH